MTNTAIKTLFLDIGGVVLTNGWDRKSRQKAAEVFHLDYDDMDERHHLTFDTYEEGKLSLDEYLTRVVFFKKRDFTPQDFRKFMFDQSKPYPDMIDLVRQLKTKYNLQTAAISNEGRELTVYRIQTFGLGEIFDFFVSSCFVHYRKPDEDIYRMALDMGQAKPEESIYIDDRCLFVEVARSLNLHGVQHLSTGETRQELAQYGLVL